MELEVPEPQEKRLKNLEKPDRERIKKKLDEIDHKISDLGVEPDKAVEKRMTGKLFPLLQQRVGRWRLWFKEDKEEDLLQLFAIKTKKQAEKHY